MREEDPEALCDSASNVVRNEMECLQFPVSEQALQDGDLSRDRGVNLLVPRALRKTISEQVIDMDLEARACEIRNNVAPDEG
jgi:hypothetical protein